LAFYFHILVLTTMHGQNRIKFRLSIICNLRTCILHIIIFVWGGIYYFNTDKNLYLSDEVEGINQTFQPGTVLETNKIIHSYFHSKKIYYISQYEFQNLVM